MKTNNCPCSYGEAQEDVDTTDLQVIYDANVITAVNKANIPLLHLRCKYNSCEHRTLQVHTRLQIKLDAPCTTGM